MRTWVKFKRIRTALLLVGVSEVALMVASVIIAGQILGSGTLSSDLAITTLLPSSLAVGVVILLCLASMGLYQLHQRLYFREAVARILVAFVSGALLLAALFYLYPAISLDRKLMTVALVIGFLLVLALRFWFLSAVDGKLLSHRTLIYGAGNRASSIADLRRKADRRGFRIVGSVPAPGDTCKLDLNGPPLEGENLQHLSLRLNVDEIVIASDDRRGNLPIEELLACKMRGIDVIDLLEFLERESGKIRVDLVSPGWLIFSPGFRVSKVRRLGERIFDLCIAFATLLLVWPVILLAALAIVIEDGLRSPILYRQTRVGYRGANFELFKFRSMVEDAEAEGQEVWAERDDVRVTGVGKFLRKYRLDELPQIFNVLRGEMSVVGPRPERPNFVEKLAESIPYYRERHNVKPGITGWAQLKYAYGATEQDALEKLQYDLYYIKNQGFLLDVAIILQTVEVVLWGKGAR